MRNGDSISVWKVDGFVPAKIIKINKNVECCAVIDSKHMHDVTYDVKLETGEISRGHLPHSIRR